MIQRIQSFYLFLAAIFVALIMIFKISTISDQNQTADLFYWSILGSEGAGAWILTVTVPLAMILFLFTIFQYKNRILQLKLSKLIYLLLAGIVTGIYLSTSSVLDEMQEGVIQVRGVAYYLPLAALALNFLASRSIMKDERLIKSVDRLR